MHRYISTFLAASLYVGAAFAPAHADSFLLKPGSDLSDKTQFLKIAYSPAIAQVKGDISRLIFQIRGLDAQESSTKTPTEQAKIDKKIALLGRLLANDNLTLLVLENSRQRQEEIRAGRPFPGTQVVPL